MVIFEVSNMKKLAQFFHLSENINTLTRILLKHAFDMSNGSESNKQERKEGKQEGEKN